MVLSVSDKRLNPNSLQKFTKNCQFTDTVREMEEVSCSDEEPEAIQPPPKKFAPTSSNGSASATAPASKKKVSPPVAGKKQGSILSFFGKK